MSNIFTDLLAENRGNDAGAEFFLATVASVDLAAGVTIIPDGDTAATTKQYKILTSGNSLLAAGDRVVVMRHSGTCIILGKIGTPGDLADFVKKTGDTMSGNLTMDDRSVIAQSDALKDGTAASSSAAGRARFYLSDKDGYNLGYLAPYFNSNGDQATLLVARRHVESSNTDVANSLYLYVAPDGTKKIVVSDAAAWRAAIAAVNKAGDTMTGNLLISKSGAESDFAMKRTDITIGTAPAADSFIGAAAFYDSANKSAGYVGVFYRPSKYVVARLLARNWNGSTNYSNYVDLYIAENGAATVRMSHPAAWRSALGLSLPVTVGQGGTGAVGVSLDNTISNIVTKSSGFTFTSAEYAQWGKIAMLHVAFNATAADTSTSWKTVGTVISQFRRPMVAVVAQGLNGKTYALMPNGNIQVTGAMSVGSVCEVTFTYLLSE